MKCNKILVALSGGVDSSVCVHLMKEQGYDVTGLVLHLSPAHNSTVEAAQAAADAMGIPLIVAQEEEWFQREVVTPWAEAYRRGQTPNPCILCNPSTKFALLCREAKARGFDTIVTGHYAGIEEREGRYLLKKAKFLPRDQSYMLYRLSQEQLSMLCLPLEGMAKDQVRAIAAQAGLPCASAPDSQEICFIPDKDYAGFIESYTGKPDVPGNFVDLSGNVLGRHKGISHYTIGQRKGLNLAMGRPVFVVEIRPDTNEVVIGEGNDVFTNILRCSKLNWMAVDGLHGGELRVSAKIRYSHRGADCTIREIGEDLVECVFDEPVRAVTPGQAVVFYTGDYVAGGGTIL